MPIPIETTVYRTADGSEFVDLAAANRHEAACELTELLNKECVGRGGMWDDRMFFDFIVDNRQKLAAILEKF